MSAVLALVMTELLTNFSTKCSPGNARLFEQDFLAVCIALEHTMSVRLVCLGCVVGSGSICQIPGFVCFEIAGIIINCMVTINVGIEIVTNICRKQSPYELLECQNQHENWPSHLLVRLLPSLKPCITSPKP